VLCGMLPPPRTNGRIGGAQGLLGKITIQSLGGGGGGARVQRDARWSRIFSSPGAPRRRPFVFRDYSAMATNNPQGPNVSLRPTSK